VLPAGHSAVSQGRGPQCEIRHARQLVEPRLRQHCQALRYCVEKGAKDARALGLKCRPQFLLGPTALLGNRFEREKQRAVGEVRPRDDVLDAVEDSASRSMASSGI
jgi:hypothetical protein